MPPPWIVEHLDIVEDILLCLVTGAIRFAPNPFPLEQLEEALSNGMAEGWTWLVREGLIAPKPGDMHGWHFVTRRGAKLKNRVGVAAINREIFEHCVYVIRYTHLLPLSES